MTPDADARATEVFEAERARLAALAYRMLGTPDDADDVVQDVWLRWAAADRSGIVEPAAWLTTVTTRLAIDRLRSARRRREVYVGPWLPEPLLAGEDDPFAEVAAHVERSEAAARQIAKRARDRVRAERPRTDADPAHDGERADAFLGAVVQGDVDGLRQLLTDDVVHLSDGGPHRRTARRPVVGADRVACLLVNLASRMEPGTRVDPVRVNGQLGWYVTVEGRPELVLVPAFRDGRVASVLAVLNADKLARFHAAWLARS